MMHSTRSDEPLGYLGVDPTSRYSATPRALDVCSLVPAAPGQLRAFFWQWQWDSADRPLSVETIVVELQRARCTMIDGPQGLATPGRTLRGSERLCRTAGKTPGRLPAADERPYGGFIRSSVELFAALHRAGLAVSPKAVVGGVNEFYPGEGWLRLTGRRLPAKTSAVGRKIRRDWLRRFGVRLSGEPTHDQLDACLGALLGAAADNQLAGIGIERLGPQLRVDRSGVLREGPIVLPKVLDAAPSQTSK